MAQVVPIDGDKLRLPSNSERLVNIGTTGSGKSVSGLWHLSMRPFEYKPYVIIDHKDEDFGDINATEIELGYMPKKPGLYITHPLPHEQKELDDFFMECWSRGHIGLYLDEVYMCGEGPGMLACLTQGRSKKIPMIMNSQRPVECSRFVFSESQYYQCFRLSDDRDYKTLRNFAKIPTYHRGEPLKEFWSWYFDVRWNKSYAMRPVPRAEVSIDNINSRLDPRQTRRFI